MKKYTQAPRHLRFIARRARRSLEARLRFKRYLRQKHIEQGQLSRPERHDRVAQFHHQPVPFTYVPAPSVLSFVRNPAEVSKFISKVTHCFDRRKPVWVTMKSVTEIDYDGITVLLSAVVRFKAKRIPFNGDFPDNQVLRDVLQQSGFIDHLRRDSFRDKDTYDLSGRSLIYTHAQKNVDSVLGQKIIESASQTVWGQKRRCPGIQRVLIELMLNTNNHASLEKEGEKHWWLSVNHSKNQKTVTFSFVDYGVGVFHSLRNKRQDSKFYGVLETLYEKFKFGSNADVLKLIFLGELHRTATGKPFRGKGLPGIYEALQKNRISNLTMITNNAYFNSSRKVYTTLDIEFQGTFVHWELTPHNVSVP